MTGGEDLLTIRKLHTAEPKTVAALAELHRRAFPGFFLTQLGLPFLRTLYACYLKDPESGVLLAEEDGEMRGFLAYSKDYSGFYKNLIRRHLIEFGFCALLAAVRHPSFTKRLLGAFKKSDSVAKTERYVELSSICVEPSASKQGIGSKLIERLKAEVDFSTYAYINLETDRDGNEGANRFYLKNGFVLAREYCTAEGRWMNEYRYAPEAGV